MRKKVFLLSLMLVFSMVFPAYADTNRSTVSGQCDIRCKQGENLYVQYQSSDYTAPIKGEALQIKVCGDQHVDYMQGDALQMEVCGDQHMNYMQGEDLRLRALDFGNSLDGALNWEQTDELDRGYPDKQKTAYFIHTIYDINNVLLGYAHVLVTGIYSEVDHEAYLTNITCTFTGPYASGLHYTKSISGSTGILTVYYGSYFSVSTTYVIHTNGSIQNG